MGSTVRYRRAVGWPWRWFRGGVLVMGPTLEPLELGGPGAVAWRLLAEPLDREALRRASASEVGEDRADEVVAAADELCAAGPLERCPGSR